jgi:hypothetical protein
MRTVSIWNPHDTRVNLARAGKPHEIVGMPRRVEQTKPFLPCDAARSMPSDRGRAVAVIVLSSAGVLALMAVAIPEQFGGGFAALLQLLTAFGVGAFVYRGERWAERTFPVVAGWFGAYAAWLSVAAATSEDLSFWAALVMAVVWINAAVTLKTSPDWQQFLEQQRSTRAARGNASGDLRAGAAEWRARVPTGVVGAGALLVAIVAIFWIVSFELGGTDDFKIQGSEVFGTRLFPSAVMLGLLGIAVVAAARRSPYGSGFLFASSAWFSLSAVRGVLRAFGPARYVPDIERELPVGLVYLVLFALACLACAVALGFAFFRDDVRPAQTERRIKAAAGTLLGFVLSLSLGRPALDTCRTERTPVPSRRELIGDTRLCRAFCSGSPRKCDFSACSAAFALPCERFSGRDCFDERECRIVRY